MPIPFTFYEEKRHQEKKSNKCQQNLRIASKLFCKVEKVDTRTTDTVFVNLNGNNNLGIVR